MQERRAGPSPPGKGDRRGIQEARAQAPVPGGSPDRYGVTPAFAQRAGAGTADPERAAADAPLPTAPRRPQGAAVLPGLSPGAFATTLLPSAQRRVCAAARTPRAPRPAATPLLRPRFPLHNA